MRKIQEYDFELNYYSLHADTLKEIPPSSCLQVPDVLIEALDPRYAGELGMLFVGIGAALIRRCDLDKKDKEFERKCEAYGKVGPLVERISQAVDHIAYMVRGGLTLKEAAESASEQYKIVAPTLLKAVEMSPNHSRAIRIALVQRMIEEGWPIEVIATRFGIHRSTVHRHAKRIRQGKDQPGA